MLSALGKDTATSDIEAPNLLFSQRGLSDSEAKLSENKADNLGNLVEKLEKNSSRGNRFKDLKQINLGQKFLIIIVYKNCQIGIIIII